MSVAGIVSSAQGSWGEPPTAPVWCSERLQLPLASLPAQAVSCREDRWPCA